MLRIKMLLIVLTLSAAMANAQSPVVKGVIQDKDSKTALRAVNVKLISQKDSTLIHYAATDSAGAFKFDNFVPETFRLTANIDGYEAFEEEITAEDSTVDLGVLYIQKKAAAAAPPVAVLPAGPVSIKGTILDKADRTPVAGASVRLVSKKDSSQKYNTLTDTKGAFAFNNINPDTYLFSATSVGYDLTDRELTVNESRDLGIVSVPKKAKELETVTVIATAPPVKQKVDTLEYAASQFKVNPDANAEDMIKKMPGVTVDKAGTVTAQGDQVRKVTIDGRDFFGDDATAALRNLPAEIIDKIQVFDRLSDQAQFTGFDDGNSAKAINVVTKANMRNGQFGRIYAGYGTDDRYSAGGNVSFFKNARRLSIVGQANNINQQNFASQDLLGVTSSGGGGRGGFGGGNFGGGGGNRGGGPAGGGNRGGGGNFGGGGNNFQVGQQSGISKTNAIGINFSDAWGKKFEMSGSYFFNNSNNLNEQTSRTQLLQQKQITDDASRSSSDNYNHRVNMRMEFKFDSSNSLIIQPSVNFQNNKTFSSASTQTITTGGDSVNTANTNNTSGRNGYNIRNNILYNHAFAKRGRTLSVNFNTTFNKNDGDAFSISKYRFFDNGFATDSLQNQFSDNTSNGYTLSGSLSYTEPIGKQGQLQFNYNPQYSSNKATQLTYLFDNIGGKYSIFDTSVSNKFDNTVTTQSGGVSYRVGNRDKMFNIGVNLQNAKLESQRTFPTNTSVNQSFTNILPNLMLRRKISPKSSINIFYRASTNAPSVTQLQDVVNNSNAIQLSVGNPSLKQQYSHFVSARYTFTNLAKGQSLFANIFLQETQDYISNATYVAAQDSSVNGVELKKGSRLTKPINLDGYKSLRSFLTYSMPVKFIKSNISLNAGFGYSKLPGFNNKVLTNTDNYTYNAGIVLASNISEYVDFNLSYSANFTDTKSSVSAPTSYINQVTGIQFNLLSKSGWFLQNDLNNQTYSGLSAGFNQSFWLWNASIGKKFLKDNAGELKLSVFDLLKQNQSLVRTITETYIEDAQSRVLQQYFMLTFTYKLKNFGTAASRRNNDNNNNNNGERRMRPTF
jgi:hypothetical protein